MRWSDDIHVYDSLSTDRTLDVARQFGAHITSRQFDNWAAHQNWGLQNIAFKYPWVFYLDADERMTPSLVADAKAVVQEAENPHVAYQVARRDFLDGTWLKRVQASKFYIRLFRPEKIRYERLVNPVSIPDGPVGMLSGHLDHFPFSKGIAHWLDRHNSYSSLEAEQILADREQGRPFSWRKALTARDFHERRIHQKKMFYRLPNRPLIKFCLLYFAKRGFLDGRAGLTYATLQSFYEFMIVLKTKELQRQFSGDCPSKP